MTEKKKNGRNCVGLKRISTCRDGADSTRNVTRAVSLTWPEQQQQAWRRPRQGQQQQQQQQEQQRQGQRERLRPFPWAARIAWKSKSTEFKMAEW